MMWPFEVLSQIGIKNKAQASILIGRLTEKGQVGINVRKGKWLANLANIKMHGRSIKTKSKSKDLITLVIRLVN